MKKEKKNSPISELYVPHNFTECRITGAALMVVLLFGSSCEKEAASPATCFEGASTVRQIKNQPALVKATGGEFLIVEENTIDTRLRPCVLSQEFQKDNLPVIISGEVKTTPREGVCCTDNFVITQINKR